MIYIAGPFFNDYQTSVIEKIKSLLDELGFEYFSPKDKNKNVENIPDEKLDLIFQKKIFHDNIIAMNQCSFSIAVIDDFDKGTIWEMGYIYCLGKPIIAYTDFLDRGMNVMLNQSIVDFAKGIEELRSKLVTWKK